MSTQSNTCTILRLRRTVINTEQRQITFLDAAHRCVELRGRDGRAESRSRALRAQTQPSVGCAGRRTDRRRMEDRRFGPSRSTLRSACRNAAVKTRDQRIWPCQACGPSGQTGPAMAQIPRAIRRHGGRHDATGSTRPPAPPPAPFPQRPTVRPRPASSPARPPARRSSGRARSRSRTFGGSCRRCRPNRTHVRFYDFVEL